MNDRWVSDPDLLSRLRDLGFSSHDEYAREAFSRNLGLVNEAEQGQLASSTVAIPGVGGVGGVHLTTLARCGVGRFHIADFDTFEPGNVNRQYGAKVSTFGKPKLDVMTNEALEINPFAHIQTFREGLTEDNVDEFLRGVDVVVDSLDFFAFQTRRMLFQRAHRDGIPVVSAGPIGFSTAMLVFLPDRGMTFDEYFDVDDSTEDLDAIVAFLVGLTPRTKYMSYMDLSKANRESGRGPSLALACQLCAGAAATETLRILLQRGSPRPAPHYAQFDPYLRRYFQGYLRWGNRHPMQRIKRRLVRRKLAGGPSPSGPDPARPADRERPSNVGAVTDEVLEYVVRAGIQAPSGDNAQPWKFGVSHDVIELQVDSQADRSFFNFRQMASVISCGAVLENMLVAASACGLESDISPFPSEGRPELVATVRLRPGSARNEPLEASLWRRHTNRTMYHRRPLLRSTADDLRNVVKRFPGVRVHLLHQPQQLRRLALVVRRADRLRVAHRGLHEHFHSMVRYTTREAEQRRDGLPLANLEAGLMGEQFLRMTRPWTVMALLNVIGFGRLFSTIAARGLRYCSAAALVTSAGTSRRDLLEGGRALERAWLTLDHLGFDVQPMTAITIFWLRCQLEGEVSFTTGQRRLLRGLWSDYRALFPEVDFEREGHVMLFRFGYGRPVAVRTLRKPLERFLTEPLDVVGSSGTVTHGAV